MSHWSDVTRNLVMQNSDLIRHHGGDLGRTAWFYVVGNDGVKTIEPAVGFYLNPPPNSRCSWSTDHGRLKPNHIVISDDCSNNGMPPRELVDWNDNTIQSKAEQYRLRYWEDLKDLVRPNTFEDLYELFDSTTLWHNGAYNLWKLVNALVTLAHDQFPYVLQDWKDCIEKVVYEVFRPVAGPSRSVGQNNNMQVLHNQHVLTDWDHTVDPLLLLQHTSFPIDFLASMNVQQHGLLRELLICEHIRLTGTKSPFPQHHNYPRPVVHTIPTPATSNFVDNQLQCAPVNSTVQAQPRNTFIQAAPVNLSSQKLRFSMPLVLVGTNDRNDQLRTQPRDTPTLSKDQATSITVSQPSVLSSPFSAPLPSIAEESTSIDNGEVNHKGVTQKAVPSIDSPVEDKPTELKAPSLEITTKGAVPITDASAPGSEASVPKITPKEATPSPDSPLRDRKDSNGSTDELFFPNRQSDKLHVGRQRSVASAPDHETDTMLTVAEKNALPVSETPPPMPAYGDQQRDIFRPSSGASVAQPSQGSLRFPVPGRKQGRQQSGPMGYQIQPVPQHDRHMGHSSPHSSQMVPHFGPADSILRSPAPFNQSHPNMPSDLNKPFIPSPSSMSAGPGGFNPYCSPPPSINFPVPMGPPMAPPVAVPTGPAMGPLFQHQMSPHMNQQLRPHGPLMNTSSIIMNRQVQYPPEPRTDGYSHQHRNYYSRGEHGDNGYSSNGYRHSNINGVFNNQYNYKRRNSFQSNGTRKNAMQSVPDAANSIPRRPGVGPQGRRFSNAGRPDQNRGRQVLFNCKNDTDIQCPELLTSRFVECSCVRCEESSRSVFVRVKPQDNKSEGDIQMALLRHFAQFHPVAAKIKRAPGKMNCLVQFHNDAEISRILHWSCNPQNQIISGVANRIITRYPLFSKHYVPQKPHGTQHQDQTHSLLEHSRRDSNPFSNLQPVDTLSIQDGSDFLGLLPRSFPPLTSIAYQQVQSHNQPRVLYDPNAPQRRDSKLPNPTSKSDQKPVGKLGCSQEMRKARFPPKGPWRQPQPNPSSEQWLADEEADEIDIVKDAPCAPPVKNSNVSNLTEEVSAARVIVSLDPSRGDSPEVDSESQDPRQVDKPPLTERHRKAKSNEERINANDCKMSGYTGDSGVAASRVAVPDTTRPSQRGNASSDELTNGEKSASNYSRITLQATNTVLKDRVSAGELGTIDEDDQESVPSSDTITPGTAKSLEYEFAIENQQNSVKNNDVHEKQADNSHLASGLASANTAVRVDTLKNDTVTSGYSMTTNQLSSAIEDVGYSMQTVIRHKPVRPPIPSSWADDEADEEAHTGTPSPIKGIHTANYRLRVLASIPIEEIVQAVMTGDIGSAAGDVLLADEANTLSAACEPNETKTNNESPASFDTESAVAMQRSSKSSRGPKRKNKSKKKKKKAQSTGSQLTSRSKTPDEILSRGSSPALERPLSAAALSNTSSRGPLTVMQDKEASSEGALLPKTVNNKQAKHKRKRKLTVAEGSDGLANSSNPQDNTKQGAHMVPSFQKTEASQDSSTQSAPLPVSTAKDPQALPYDYSGNPSKANFRSYTAGGSLRMPKNRSPKKGSLTNEPRSTMKDQAPTLSAGSSLLSVLDPPAKDGGIHAEASLSVHQNVITDASKKPTPPEMSLEKPDSKRSTIKISKSNDIRVALPKAALPLPQLAGSTKASGNCASIAKGPASHGPKADKKDENDPFNSVKEQMTLGSFIKDKNVKSSQKPKGTCEKNDVSPDKASSSSSPGKEWHRRNTIAKSQLNAAVKSFDPSASCTSLTTLTKPRLNPNAASFSLASSPSHSVASALASFNGTKGRNAMVVSAEEKEKPVAAQRKMAPAERDSVQEGHEKKPSPSGHTRGMDKCFITPAEKVLDLKRVVPPPPPSKESKRAGPIPERSRAPDRGTGPTITSQQSLADSVVANESKKEAAYSDTAERSKGTKAARRTTAHISADVGTRPRSTSPKTVPESRSNSEHTALNADLFPTLDQAAAVGTTKKRRTASILKADLPIATAAGPVSGMVVGRNITGSSQTSCSIQPKQGEARMKQTYAPHSPAPAVAEAPLPNVAQKHTNTHENEPKQPGDKDSWQTVVPKQKNNGGSSKGHGGRAGKYGSLRSARNARGGRDRHDGATEERKGG